ncbi:hypothetical protein EB796_013225 [Bugula neritina]|uniref:DDE Tnp4 domain-containing protein n=1 Tax=Bugula neritina TaxID=10212 RepID=A0A7J7JR45_BUGNE|nr:hypothetical protein EB796_013225 [Bugula neritina]
MIDVGSSGCNNDAGVWAKLKFSQGLENGTINLPDPSTLYGSSTQCPYMFVGDEAFPLRPFLMRPYSGRSISNHSQRVFNYRLSRARRVIENAFGILTQRWRILFKPIIPDATKAAKLVRTVCVLHNFLKKTDDKIYCPPGYSDQVSQDGNVTPGFWRTAQAPNVGLNLRNRSSTTSASEMREKLTVYFCNEGKVSWQDNHVNRR